MLYQTLFCFNFHQNIVFDISSDGSIFFTAPQTVTETNAVEQFTSFGGWYDSGAYFALFSPSLCDILGYRG